MAPPPLSTPSSPLSLQGGRRLARGREKHRGALPRPRRIKAHSQRTPPRTTHLRAPHPRLAAPRQMARPPPPAGPSARRLGHRQPSTTPGNSPGPVSAEEADRPDEVSASPKRSSRTPSVVEARDNTRVLRELPTPRPTAEGRIQGTRRPRPDSCVVACSPKRGQERLRFPTATPTRSSTARTTREAWPSLLDVPEKTSLPGRGYDGEQDFAMFNQPVFIRDIAEYRQNLLPRLTARV